MVKGIKKTNNILYDLHGIERKVTLRSFSRSFYRSALEGDILDIKIKLQQKVRMSSIAEDLLVINKRANEIIKYIKSHKNESSESIINKFNLLADGKGYVYDDFKYYKPLK